MEKRATQVGWEVKATCSIPSDQAEPFEGPDENSTPQNMLKPKFSVENGIGLGVKPLFSVNSPISTQMENLPDTGRIADGIEGNSQGNSLANTASYFNLEMVELDEYVVCVSEGILDTKKRSAVFFKEIGSSNLGK